MTTWVRLSMSTTLLCLSSGFVAQNSLPLPSSRHRLSCGDCLEHKRKNYQNCSVLCCIRQLYAVIRTHTQQKLKLSLGLVFVCLFRFRILCVLWFSLDYFVCFFSLDCFVRSCAVCFCCLRFSFFSTGCYAKRLAGRTFPKWPILCDVGRKTLTESINLALAHLQGSLSVTGIFHSMWHWLSTLWQYIDVHMADP